MNPLESLDKLLNFNICVWRNVDSDGAGTARCVIAEKNFLYSQFQSLELQMKAIEGS